MEEVAKKEPCLRMPRLIGTLEHSRKPQIPKSLISWAHHEYRPI